jgi:hypothetical protein
MHCGYHESVTQPYGDDIRVIGVDLRYCILALSRHISIAELGT